MERTVILNLFQDDDILHVRNPPKTAIGLRRSSPAFIYADKKAPPPPDQIHGDKYGWRISVGYGHLPRHSLFAKTHPAPKKLRLFCHSNGMDLPALYVEWTNMPLDALGMSHAMAHIHVGLIIYVGMQFILRTRRASAIALQAVFGAEMVNEILQRAYYGSWRWPDTLADMALTMLWPTLLYGTAKIRRARWNSRLGRAQAGMTLMQEQQARLAETSKAG